MRIYPVAEDALMLNFGGKIDFKLHKQLISLQKQINKGNYSGIFEAVIGFTTIVVYFDPSKQTHEAVEKLLLKLKGDIHAEICSPALHRIPVCYESEYSPDLEYVAKYHHITAEEVINLHTTPIYTVYFIGFSPGFPFLGGMDEKIATPRKVVPQQSVYPGSVGIAGKQTGIYPSQSPGGWQIIGRTPKNLLQLDKEQPTLLQPGDQIVFYQVNQQEYREIENNEGSLL